MKKISAALLSAVFLAAPIFGAVEASAQERHHRPPVVEKRVIEKRVVTKRYVRGHRLSADDRRRFREVRDYRAYRLAPPPRGYHWVRSDRDFILVGITSGIISSIITGR